MTYVAYVAYVTLLCAHPAIEEDQLTRRDLVLEIDVRLASR